MTPQIHDLLHKLARLNKTRERNSRKFSKVLTQLIIEVEAIGKTESIDDGARDKYIAIEGNTVTV